jgi:hypothetical protein
MEEYTMELIKLLTEKLGVSQDQAQGGAGLLFQLAKDKLGPEDFGQIAQQVPGIDAMVESAPESGMLGSALKGLASGLGGGNAGLGNLAGLAGGFSKLGLDSGMIGKFIPVILSFVQGKGGDAVKGMLSRALG